MKKSISILFLLMSIQLLHAQTYSIEPIKQNNPNFPQHQYQFPILTKGNKAITQAINNHLTSNFLEIEFGKQKESIFENIWATVSNNVPMLNDITFKVLTLNDKLYAVTLSAEGCGAYCEYFSQSFAFDLSTGEAINNDLLFSDKGKAAFIELLITRRAKKIITFIDNISDTLSQKNLNDEDRAYYQEMKELYEECVEEAHITSLKYQEIRLNNKNIIVVIDRCSAHYNQNLDELGNFELDFIADDIREWLSEYGRKMLL